MAHRQCYDTSVLEGRGGVRAKDLYHIDTEVGSLMGSHPVQKIAEYKGSGLTIHEIFGISNTFVP